MAVLVPTGVLVLRLPVVVVAVQPATGIQAVAPAKAAVPLIILTLMPELAAHLRAAGLAPPQLLDILLVSVAAVAVQATIEVAPVAFLIWAAPAAVVAAP